MPTAFRSGAVTYTAAVDSTEAQWSMHSCLPPRTSSALVATGLAERAAASAAFEHEHKRFLEPTHSGRRSALTSAIRHGSQACADVPTCRALLTPALLTQAPRLAPCTHCPHVFTARTHPPIVRQAT